MYDAPIQETYSTFVNVDELLNNNFKNFNFFSVKDEVIEHLNKFDYSENGVFNKKTLRRYSRAAAFMI